MSVRLLRPVVTSILVALAACGRSGSPQPPPPKVTVAQPVERDVTEWDEYTARLEAVDSVEVRAARQRLPAVGALRARARMVQKGDLLFQIDPRPYEAALRRAEGDLALAKARLELARKNLARADPAGRARTRCRRRRPTRARPRSRQARGGRRGGAGGGRRRASSTSSSREITAPIERPRQPQAGHRGQPHQRRRRARRARCSRRSSRSIRSTSTSTPTSAPT